MARKGVTYEETLAAIEQLQNQGIQPTVQGIRDLLGRGSFTTLSEQLRHWRFNQRQASQAQRSQSPLPEDLQVLAQKFWTRACDQAREALAEQQAAAEAQVKQALEEKAEALETARQIEERNLILDQKNDQLIAEAKAQAVQHSRLETQWLQEAQQYQNLCADQAAQLEKQSQALAAHPLEIENLKAAQAKALAEFKEESRQQLLQEQERNQVHQERWLQEVDLARQAVREMKDKLEQTSQTWVAREAAYSSRIQQLEQALAEAVKKQHAEEAETQRLQQQWQMQEKAEAEQRAALETLLKEKKQEVLGLALRLKQVQQLNKKLVSLKAEKRSQ